MAQATIDNLFLNSNIIDEAEAKEKIRSTLSKIAQEVSRSLGPYGSTTIIEDRLGDHYMTKDGYTILKAMNYNYDISRTVLDIVKKISKSLVRTVGDGSTSSVIIANELFGSINTISEKLELAPQDILEIFNVLAEKFEELILEHATQITDENFDETITKIATISCNNNQESGKLFCDIFKAIGRYGFINLENGKSSKDYFEKVQGIEVPRGWINARMANQSDRISTEYENALVFMMNDMMSDDEIDVIAGMMDTICIKQNVPLILIATNYTSSVKSFFDANLQKNKHLPVVAIDIDASTKRGRERFEDLALALGCHYYDKFNGMEKIKDFSIKDLGKCKRFKGDDLKSIFIDGDGYTSNAEKLQEHIKNLEDEYQRLQHMDEIHDNRETDLFQIKKRIATLTSSMATLYVGGNSEMERTTRKFLMEDAVYACRSSIEHGYVVGGNLILPKLIDKYETDIITKTISDKRLEYLFNIYETVLSFSNAIKFILDTVFSAFKKSFLTVLENAHINKEKAEEIIDTCLMEDKIYNVKLRRYENDNETNVINSAQTDIEIIKASFSIIGLLATSNQFITTNPMNR